MATTPRLNWAVKDSLVSYIERLDDGVVEVLAPASRAESGFDFPWDETSPWDQATADEGGALQFSGGIRLTGHWGALNVEVREPRIELDGESATLWIREHGSNDPQKRLPFATLTFGPQQTSPDGSSYVEAEATLTGHGRLVLGAQYSVGEALSVVRITYPARDA